MLSCPSCSSAVPEGSRFCAACGVPVDAGVTCLPPVEAPAPTRPAGTFASPVRTGVSNPATLPAGQDVYVAGTLLADRYRVVGLLGKGGMGEVYRADDLKLGEPVALKFLPRDLSGDASRLVRLMAEVRAARQVAHPNVCCVYDAGEADGRQFLTMEYIDGEDLATSIRRIGRFPADKGLEIARQLCAGLAAVHDRGLLHRDLKPANVMLDGRGRVRLTDFGLASEAAGQGGAGELAGTPAYMAPELLAGKPATVQSDIYALGLVLFEVFSGRRAFDAATIAGLRQQQESGERPSLSSATGAIEPAIEEVVRRCLDTNPAARPVSAISVAARLPGGDPLAAALAAGETPSPAMVAAAGESGGLRPGIAIACLAGFFVLLAAVGLVGQYGFTRLVPLDYPPDVLANKAQEMLGRFGYGGKPFDAAHGMYWNKEYIDNVARTDKGPDRWLPIREGQEAGLVFWYRASPHYLTAHEYFGIGLANGRVDIDDPSRQSPGQQSVWLSSSGRLLRFEAVPPLVEPPLKEPAPAVDWPALFEAAGLDMTAYRPADPTWAPPSWGDTRAAWVEATAARIEAAAWRGKPVSFRVIHPWTPGQGQTTPPPTAAVRAGQVLAIVILLTLVVGGVLLARYNVARGRGDMRGASRLAVFVCGLILVGWAIEASHVPTLWEAALFVLGLSYALFAAVTVWLLYVALEPFIRRLWPHTIISWSRMLGGQFRDPLVGRDILVGSLCGALFGLIRWMEFAGRSYLGFHPFPIQPALDPLLGSRFLASAAISFFYSAIVSTLGLFVLIFLLRLVLRRDWLAGGALIVVATAAGMAGTDLPLLTAAFNIAALLVFVTLLLRFGLVAVCVANVIAATLSNGFPLSMEFSRWYGGATVVVLLALSAVAVLGFRLSQGGHPVREAGMSAGTR
jgi:predicted Ser/Thr protein kinase